MTPRVFSDYDLISLESLEGRKQFTGAITAFMRQPEEVGKKLIEAGVTAFTGTDEFPREVTLLIEKYHLGLGEIDVAYERFFDTRDFSSMKAPGFRIRDVSSGLTFSKRAEGGRAHIYRISGTEIFVGFDMYGGGLSFDQAWFEDQEWWLIEDTAAEFRSKWYTDKATTMYDLIGNQAATLDISYDSGGANQLEKDINTINAAAYDLLSTLRSSGYAITPETPILMLTPVKLKSRTERALAQQRIVTGIAATQGVVEYSVTPVYSLGVRDGGSITTTKWFMAVPGMKNKLGEKMPLTVFASFKPEEFATTTVGWGRYGAYLNEEQWRRMATA